MKLQKSYRNRRFLVIVWLALLVSAMIIFGGYLAISSHPSYSDWIGFIVVTSPVLVGAIGAWLGIETGKMKGGRAD